MSARAAAVRLLAPGRVPESARAAVRVVVRAAGGSGGAERVLADGTPGAWELRTDVPASAIREAIRRVADEQAVDAAVVDAPAGADDRPVARRLVVLDVDSTLIEQEVIELIAEHAGTRAEVAAVTEAAMRGELDFAASLRARVATLAGLPLDALAETRAAVTLTPGARTLVAALHSLGHRVGVVSGGFAEILDPIAADLRLDHAHANRLAVAEGRLTGAVDGPIVDRAAKAACLRAWAAADGIDLADCVAIGDGANDLDMLAAAGLGVAFCAKPAVRAAADATVSVRRLDAVLYLLGLTAADVAGALAGTGLHPGD